MPASCNRFGTAYHSHSDISALVGRFQSKWQVDNHRSRQGEGPVEVVSDWAVVVPLLVYLTALQRTMTGSVQVLSLSVAGRDRERKCM